jgi:hypothetical protein
MPNPNGNIATLTSWKPRWLSGATQTIRVPVDLAEEILDYAHKLDKGEINSTPCDTESLSQVVQALEEIYQTPRNNFSRERKALLRTAIDKLKSLSQVV